MKKILLLTSIVFSHLFLFAGNEFAITTTNLNLRESNSTNSTSLKVLNQGDTLEILSPDPNWTKVKVDNLEGFVSSEYLIKIDMAEATAESTKKETFFEAFKRQKGFVAGFKYIFIRGFIIVLLIFGSIYTLKARTKDARFKQGFRQGKVDSWSWIKSSIYAVIAALLTGFIGGIISIFH